MTKNKKKLNTYKITFTLEDKRLNAATFPFYRETVLADSYAFDSTNESYVFTNEDGDPVLEVKDRIVLSIALV